VLALPNHSEPSLFQHANSVFLPNAGYFGHGSDEDVFVLHRADVAVPLDFGGFGGEGFRDRFTDILQRLGAGGSL
jgi:hypothetical protein